MSETRIEELIEIFDRLDGDYKREEMEEALTLREEITPHLIRILESIAADPDQYIQEEHYANVYGVALLAHFQEPAAHLPIIRAFSIPRIDQEEIWGDMVTETLPVLLFQTCNGHFDAIRELVCNREADDYVRNAAAEALTFGVARGLIERREVVEFLRGLLTGSEAGEGSYFWSDIACALADLHPLESLETIRQAYADGLVFSGVVGLEEIEEDASRSQEEMLLRLRADVDRRIPEDVHGYISWFARFREDLLPAPPPVDYTLAARQKKKQKSRARSKQAKKSRKKNRR